MKDLRFFLKTLEKEAPEEIVRVTKEISPEYEITALLTKLEQQNRLPAVIFEKVKGSDLSVITNVHSSRKRLAMALETTEKDLVDEYRRREDNPVPPKLVDDGPVKEIIKMGRDIDLTEFPLVTHHEMDGAPYITASIVVVKDPDTKVRNASFGRLMVVGKDKLRTHITPVYSPKGPSGSRTSGGISPSIIISA